MLYDDSIKNSGIIKEISNKYQFEKACLRDNENCVIALVDGRVKYESLYNKFHEAMDNWNSIQNLPSFKEHKFYWVNATCHVFLLY